jgi:catechol 2,3-dioxygenase-like lactoylglutathione lyase family enzyme
MITGTHAIIHSLDAERTRAFFKDTLGFRSVDAGEGWLIFALPPAEMGVHPAEAGGSHELYLMCDDIEKTVDELRAKGVSFSGEISSLGWGRMATMQIPGGGEMGLYEPRHPTAI